MNLNIKFACIRGSTKSEDPQNKDRRQGKTKPENEEPHIYTYIYLYVSAIHHVLKVY